MITTASGQASHAEGGSTTASGQYSHAEGRSSVASGSHSHVQGILSTASGYLSKASGFTSTASGYSSLARGFQATASGDYSRAEGARCTASGYLANATGTRSLASKPSQHAHSGGTGAIGGTGIGQNTDTPLFVVTTSATQTEMTIDGASAAGTTEPASNRFLINASKAYAITVTVGGKQQSSSNVFMGRYAATIVNIGGTITLSPVTNLLGTDINPGAWGGVITGCGRHQWIVAGSCDRCDFYQYKMGWYY